MTTTSITNTHGGVARNGIIRSVRALTPQRALATSEAHSVAERQAFRLLELLDITRAPVDLDAIASLPGLEVRTVRRLPVSGFSEWARSRWLIAIREDDALLRQRFTLAHELKHVLDHPYVDGLYPNHQGHPSQSRAEAICDYFAGCLLMPRPWLKRAWVSGHQDLRDLAGAFGVSRAAMAVRLRQVGLTLPTPRCAGPDPRATFGIGSLRRYTREAVPSFEVIPAPQWGTWP